MRLTGLMPLPFLLATGCGGCDFHRDVGPEFFGGPPDSGVIFPNEGDGGLPPQNVFHPFLPPTVSAHRPPPPISGGTLEVTADQEQLVASDPDRDTVALVQIAEQRVVWTLALNPGDEPGRIAEDRDGRIHVVLRKGGAIVTLDRGSGRIIERRDVCTAPRGIAYDRARDVLRVACAEGLLVTLPAPGGRAISSVMVEPDLRDVVVNTYGVWVSTFRSPVLISVDDDGSIDRGATTFTSTGAAPTVGWRMVRAGDDGIAMVHQLAQSEAVVVQPGGYGGDGLSFDACSQGIVRSALTEKLGFGSVPSSTLIPDAVLPVDIARSQDGGHYAIAAAGNAYTPELQGVLVVLSPSFGSSGSCATPLRLEVPGSAPVIAVAFDRRGQLYAQTRQPAELLFLGDPNREPNRLKVRVALSTDSREDTGHTIFHTNAGARLACASCHPEGADDGHVWEFDRFGPRRTPSLLGTIDGTAPYHWDGALPDLRALFVEVYEGRMSGAPLLDGQAAALESWLDTLPAPQVPPPADSAMRDAAARGNALFNGSAGCNGCHRGEKLTSNLAADVGTGGAFQVPSLVGVRWRAPYLHTGCAVTLRDRFSSWCGGAMHGATDSLTEAQVDDLIAYLDTL